MHHHQNPFSRGSAAAGGDSQSQDNIEEHALRGHALQQHQAQTLGGFSHPAIPRNINFPQGQQGDLPTHSMNSTIPFDDRLFSEQSLQHFANPPWMGTHSNQVLNSSQLNLSSSGWPTNANPTGSYTGVPLHPILPSASQRVAPTNGNQHFPTYNSNNNNNNFSDFDFHLLNQSFPDYSYPTSTSMPTQQPGTNIIQDPQEAQAADLLTRIAQGQQFHTTGDQNQCDHTEVCDQACDPSSIIPCTTVDPRACYDESCERKVCDQDGVDTSCLEPHITGSIHHGFQIPITYNTSGEGNNWMDPTSAPVTPSGGEMSSYNTSARNSFDFSSRINCSHHEEHRISGCVNPQDLLKLPDDLCCCGDTKQHGPDRTSILRQRELQASRVAKKHQHRRDSTIDTQRHSFSGISGSSTEHSRNSSITQGMPGISPISTLSQYPSNVGLTDNPNWLSSHMGSEDDESTDTIQAPTFAQDFEQRPSGNHVCCWLTEFDTSCSFDCNTAEGLQKHVEQRHIFIKKAQNQKKTERGPGHVCRWEDCDAAKTSKTFRQIQHLKDHVRTHTKYKPCVCDYHGEGLDICNKEFGDRKALESHMRTHTGEKPFECADCPAIFAHQSSLNTHILKHLKEKKFTCKICGHKDNDRANLGRHFDTHFDNRFSCRYCQKTFSKKANGMRHLKNGSCSMANSHFGRRLEKQDIEGGILQAPRPADWANCEQIAESPAESPKEA